MRKLFDQFVSIVEIKTEDSFQLTIPLWSS